MDLAVPAQCAGGHLEEIADERRGLADLLAGHGRAARCTEPVQRVERARGDRPPGRTAARPLGLTHPVPAERWQKSLTFLTTPSGRSLVAPELDGLRLHAEDVDWSHGSGPTVSGDADALLLAMTGRRSALDHLTGEGVATLRDRMP